MSSKPTIQTTRSDKAAAAALGAAGEELVAQAYRAAGFSIVDRNWRCRHGELDIVAVRQGLAVFCEVKARSSRRYVDPALAVDWRKQQKLRSAALAWLADKGRFRALRFDVATVVGDEIRVIPDAF